MTTQLTAAQKTALAIIAGGSWPRARMSFESYCTQFQDGARDAVNGRRYKVELVRSIWGADAGGAYHDGYQAAERMISTQKESTHETISIRRGNPCAGGNRRGR